MRVEYFTYVCVRSLQTYIRMKKISYYLPFILLCFATIFISCEDEQLEGEFFSTPDGSDPAVFCAETGPLAIAEAQLALSGLDPANAQAGCDALKATITSFIATCGDEGGGLQLLLDELGNDCNLTTDGGGDDDDGSVDTVFFITFRADGELIDMRFDSASTSADFLPNMSYSGSGDCNRDYSPGLNNNGDNSTPQSGLDFYNLLTLNDLCNTTSESEAINLAFPIGNYSYSSSDNEYGVGFGYAPSPDTNYLSVEGAQSGSSFEIQSSEESNIFVAGNLFEAGQIITGRFSCTIYDEINPGESIVITDGSFRLRVSGF